MIIGGWIGSTTATVLKFDANDLNKAPEQVESMLNGRSIHACTIFNSVLHDGRPLAIVAGGYDGSTGTHLNKAEIWDFTKEGTSWQQSNIILLTYYLFLLYCSKEWVMSVSDLFYIFINFIFLLSVMGLHEKGQQSNIIFASILSDFCFLQRRGDKCIRFFLWTD